MAIPYILFSFAVPIGRDSGVFLYSGWIINEGGAPYVDAWDHKGPLLYLFDAAGLALSGDGAGVILLEGLLLFLSLFISMQLWDRHLFKGWILLVAFFFSLYFYATFEGGNLTESWYVPFSLLTYSLAFVYFCGENLAEKNRDASLFSVFYGVSLAVAALTRPNNGLGLAVLGPVFLIIERKRFRKLLAYMFMSGSVVAMPIIFYLYRMGAIGEFFDQYLAFNFSYVNKTGILPRAEAFYRLSRGVLFSGLGLLTTAAWGYLFFSEADEYPGKNDDRFVWLMVAVFFVEILSQALSGKGHVHYISLLSSSLGLLLVGLLRVIDRDGRRLIAAKKWRGLLLLAPIFCVTSLSSARALWTPLKTGTAIPGSASNELIKYVQANSASDDEILVHGAETWLLFASKRRSPTNVTYYYPAIANFRDSYDKYVSDVVNRKPLYIIESPVSCGLSKPACNPGQKTFSELKFFLEENYRFETKIRGFQFWRRK